MMAIGKAGAEGGTGLTTAALDPRVEAVANTIRALDLAFSRLPDKGSGPQAADARNAIRQVKRGIGDALEGCRLLQIEILNRRF